MGGGGEWDQGRCERRSGFSEILKLGGGGRVMGVRVDVNGEVKFFLLKIGGGGRVGLRGGGGQGSYEQRSEVFEKIPTTKKKK